MPGDPGWLNDWGDEDPEDAGDRLADELLEEAEGDEADTLVDDED